MYVLWRFPELELHRDLYTLLVIALFNLETELVNVFEYKLVGLIVCFISHIWPTAWSTILIEKLIFSQFIKESLQFYGKERRIPVFRTGCDSSLFPTILIQFVTSNPIYLIYILILSSRVHVFLPSSLFRRGLPVKSSIMFPSTPCVPYDFSTFPPWFSVL
jgi:hypothetical protein